MLREKDVSEGVFNMTSELGMEISPEAVRGAINKTFEMAQEYVREHEHQVVDAARYIGPILVSRNYIDINHQDSVEGTRIYVAQRNIQKNISELDIDQYEVDELFIVSRSLYHGLAPKYRSDEMMQTGFGLARYKDGSGLKQYYEVPGAFRGNTYYGSERRVRILQKTGNVSFPKAAGDAHKLRTMNILKTMQSRIQDAQ